MNSYKEQGRFSYRRKPAPEQVKATKEAALDCCPECGGSLTERKQHEQFVVDIPHSDQRVGNLSSESNPYPGLLVDLQRATGNPPSLGSPQSAPT